MPITRTERIENWANSQLVSSQDITVDVTAETVVADLLSKAPAALAANSTFLGLGSPSNAQVLAQVQRLTRQVNALIRHEVASTHGLTTNVNTTTDT